MQATIAAVPFYPAGARREIMRQAARFAGTGEPAAIAVGHWQIAVQSGDRRAVAEAIVWSDRALDALDGPQDNDWAGMALIGAEVRRLRGATGDRDRSRELGLSALKCHTWRVLLQSGTDHALIAAREAIEDALTVADWCVEDGQADDLVLALALALDAGRGLALHAAVTTRSAIDRLADLGENRLAADWVKAPRVRPAGSGTSCSCLPIEAEPQVRRVGRWRRRSASWHRVVFGDRHGSVGQAEFQTVPGVVGRRPVKGH